MKRCHLLLLVVLLFPQFASGKVGRSAGSAVKNKMVDWFPGEMSVNGADGVRFVGNPTPVITPYGRAMAFNGQSDGLFLDRMPLAGLEKFTIEMLICPAKGGNFEQRYFHCGEIRGSRIMMELRSTANDWYLDAFFKSGDQQKTLIDAGLTHPLDQWTHVAFLVDRNLQQTFVNGTKELESRVSFLPFEGGKTSLGVRQNELSWFKGAIYRIRITPKILKPKQFFKY